jgi:hypothetical protein
MSFDECPICGETNFEESNSGLRVFPCGFQGSGFRRVNRCHGLDESPRPEVSIPDSINRYRLAFLDAAHAADTIAGDMTSENIPGDYARRCRELAQQMREFAGHTHGFGIGRKESGRGWAIMRYFRRS